MAWCDLQWFVWCGLVWCGVVWSAVRGTSNKPGVLAVVTVVVVVALPGAVVLVAVEHGMTGAWRDVEWRDVV